MLNTSFISSLGTDVGTSLRPRQLNREEEQLIRYYRLLSEQDREAVRCLMFAVKETSRPERPRQ
ncbi:hypothetical protein [Pseudomonas sp. efr-133-TYG-23]|uniref:hypothetical protein n=1 Tax=Pseudomonas sp. efr-133-TYG-23 TaxID=3040309 RepID=UPI0025564E03|nr:hypothetical protein [Pseudomonas sp. efr-133-TYG-23]